jgi:diguanylate cyclase (GGDEF)-like protein
MSGTGIARWWGTEVIVGSSVPFFLGLIVTAGLLIPVLLRMRASIAEARAESQSAGPRLQSLQRANSELQEDLGFLKQFLKEFPRLARELYSGLGERQIPGVLLSIVQRSLDPQQVAILVRRVARGGRVAKGKKPVERLIVAATYPEGAAVKIGAEVDLDVGEIGFATESQIVVNRQDLEKDEATGRITPGGLLPGMQYPDLIAPLVFDQETVGVILVSKPRKSGDPKAALRLVAQSGAQVLHTAAQVSRMRHTAAMDGLTRIFNKKHMEQTLNELVYRAACAAYDQREGSQGAAAQSLSVFLFDIDNFKNYNDNNGHLAGDNLLLELAGIVQNSVRKDDIFGRFGGEEFLLILPHTNAQQAMAAAEKVRVALATHPFAFAEKQPMKCISVSGGVSEYPHDGLDAAGLLNAADEALYKAKSAGRNKVLPAVRGAAAPAGSAPGAQEARRT